MFTLITNIYNLNIYVCIYGAMNCVTRVYLWCHELCMCHCMCIIIYVCINGAMNCVCVTVCVCIYTCVSMVK